MMRSTMPAASAVGGFDGLAERAHLDRLGDARQPRQPLRAGRAGNDAELHFRLSDLRRGDRDAIVPGHGDFEAAAERRAVDRQTTGLGESSIVSSSSTRLSCPCARRR